jgi:septal ring factor EnvC (AmiA/AmiB activator)
MVYEKNDQVMDIEDKINKITFNPEKEAASLNLQKDELKRLQDYLRSLKNEIQALEQKGTSLVHTN